MLRALVGLMAAMALVPTATTLAAWTDEVTARGPASGTATITPVLTCETGLGSARVTWPAVTSPTAVTYTARVVGGSSLTPVAGNPYYVDLVSLLGSLVNKTYVIEVTATLPLTSWQDTTSVTVKTILGGTVVSC